MSSFDLLITIFSAVFSRQLSSEIGLGLSGSLGFGMSCIAA